MAEDQQQIIDFIVSQYHASAYESTPLPLASRSYQDLEPTSCDYLPPTGADHQTLPWDISAEQFRPTPPPSTSSMAKSPPDPVSSRMKSEALPPDMLMREEGRTDSGFDWSDQHGEEEDEQCHGRRVGGGKRQQAKNLDAERRRKKLNDQLYALRALVPNISKAGFSNK